MADLEYSPRLGGFVPFGTTATATQTITPTGADDLYVLQTGTLALPDGLRGASLTIGGGPSGTAPTVIVPPGAVFAGDITVASGGALQLGPDLASASASNPAVLTGSLEIDAGAAGVTVTAGIFAGPVVAGGPLAIEGFATFAAPVTFPATPQLTSLAGSQTNWAAPLSTATLQAILQSPGFAGSLTVTGTLDNTGTTLDLAAFPALSFSNALISGGTLAAALPDILPATTLDNVTLAGTLHTEAGDRTILSGTISGGTFAIDGTLEFSGTTAIGQSDITLGPGALIFGGDSSSTSFLVNSAIYVSDAAQLAFSATGAQFSFDGTLDLSASVTPYLVEIDNQSGSTLLGADADISIGANATLKINSGIFSSGTVAITGGTLDIAGTGTIGTLSFAGSDSVLQMETLGQAATLLDFQDGDSLVFPGAGLADASVVLTGNTLDVYSGRTSRLAGHFILGRSDGGSYTAQDFVFGTTGSALSMATNGVAVAACYAAGTRIATEFGERPIETLAPGIRVRTQSDALSPIRWIGHRTLDLARHAHPHDVQPVRIAAHAFGPGLPRRDLRLSPDHAVFAEGALIPIRYLVNGATIVQERQARITYLHVELARHDIILAEGLPAETFLDTGNRGAFANGGAPMHLHPDFALRIWQAKSCAPLVTGGETLALVRAALLAQAARLGHHRTDDPALRILPTPTGLLLASRIFIPAHMTPRSNDHRPLGVPVTRLHCDGIPVPLDDPRLSTGWHSLEPGLRWTTGAATLALPPTARLTVTCLPGVAQYWRQPPRYLIA